MRKINLHVLVTQPTLITKFLQTLRTTLSMAARLLKNIDLWRDGRSDQQAREWLLMPKKGGRFAPWGVGGAGGTGGRRLHGVY